MQDLELRVQTLEQKCRTLKRYVVGLTCCAVLAAVSGAVSLNRTANAAGEEEIDPKDIGIPSVVEAQVFMLKDSAGNIRGIWNADDTTTSFAMMHKGKFPIIAMAVDNKNASMSLTDVYKGKINIGLNNSIRSMSVTDDTGKNNIYMGLTGTGEASIDMVSTGDSSFVIDGKTSSIDMTGDRNRRLHRRAAGAARQQCSDCFGARQHKNTGHHHNRRQNVGIHELARDKGKQNPFDRRRSSEHYSSGFGQLCGSSRQNGGNRREERNNRAGRFEKLFPVRKVI